MAQALSSISQSSTAHNVNLFREVLEMTMDSIAVIDGKGRLVHVNAPFLAMFDYTHDELIGKNINVFSSCYFLLLLASAGALRL